MTEIAAPAIAQQPERTGFRRLMLFFALVYLAEGVCQSDGLSVVPLIDRDGTFGLRDGHERQTQ